MASAFAEYNRSSAPFFLIEGRYEAEQGATEQTVRRQAYQSVLSGASGHLMGNGVIWPFASGWQQALNSPGSRSMTHVSTIFTTRQWWKLVPDQANTTLTKMRGASLSATAFAPDSRSSASLSSASGSDRPST